MIATAIDVAVAEPAPVAPASCGGAAVDPASEEPGACESASGRAPAQPSTGHAAVERAPGEPAPAQPSTGRAPGEATPVESAPAGHPPVERVPVESRPAVPASRRLSPRSDAALASFTATRNGALAARDLRLKAGAPIVRGDGYGAGLLVGYGSTHLDIAMAGLDRELALHRFDVTLGGGAGFAPGWSLRGSVGVSHGSDLHDTDWTDLQLTSSASVHHVLGDSDAIVVGVVYTSSAELLPVLPMLGYVHHRDGSRFRLDVFLPRHARGEYALRHWARVALGVEAMGDTWNLQVAGAERHVRRAGGSVFGELQLLATAMIRVQARAGLSVESYTVPSAPDGAVREQPLRAAGIAQLAVLIAP